MDTLTKIIPSTQSETEIRSVDKEMAQAVYDNVLEHLIGRALNGEKKRDEAGYFAINLGEDDHSGAYNHFRSLFGIEVDPNEKPIRPLNNRVLASYGNFALIQQVQFLEEDTQNPNAEPLAYGVNIAVVGLCPERGGPLVVNSI